MCYGQQLLVAPVQLVPGGHVCAAGFGEATQAAAPAGGAASGQQLLLALVQLVPAGQVCAAGFGDATHAAGPAAGGVPAGGVAGAATQRPLSQVSEPVQSCSLRHAPLLDDPPLELPPPPEPSSLESLLPEPPELSPVPVAVITLESTKLVMA